MGFETHKEPQWTCEVLSEKDDIDCTLNGENCMESKCCDDKSATCFVKNDEWASCNHTCHPHNFWNFETKQFETHTEPQWTCDTLGCTQNGHNCTESKCCVAEGAKCFKKNDEWASCNHTCHPHNFWNFETEQFETHKEPQWTC